MWYLLLEQKGVLVDNPLYTLTEEERSYVRETCEAESARLSPFAARDSDAVYETPVERDRDDELVRPNFVNDIDRVLNNPYYNRCMDKTQVFPLYRNDDLTRRSYHLQLVAQISCKVSRALRLNVPLTRAIALGHDMGHTPFGHAGEKVLSALYHEHTGKRYFNHNVHSVRLLRTVSDSHLSLQTLNGMLCHCGEKAWARYEPRPCPTFDDLDEMMERCYTVPKASTTLRPSTLEGCVVRVCDIIAYLGKDRQDAITVGVLDTTTYPLRNSAIGETNREIIGNVTANLIKNSIGKPYLAMDEPVFQALDAAKRQNIDEIYNSPEAHGRLDEVLGDIMGGLYDRCLEDLLAERRDSPIWRHHLNAWMLRNNDAYRDQPPDDIVVDYLACTTDEYLIALFNHLFPEDAIPEEDLYIPYFR